MVGTLERTEQTAPMVNPSVPAPQRPQRPQRRLRRSTTWMNTLAPIVAFILLIVAWKIVVVVGGYKPFLLPPPETVARSFWGALRDGILWPHLRTTLIEAGYGALLGIAVAFLLG